MKVLDRRARASVVPESAEDKGVSGEEIGEKTVVFIGRVSWLLWLFDGMDMVFRV
jgi:hypothetical protein